VMVAKFLPGKDIRRAPGAIARPARRWHYGLSRSLVLHGRPKDVR